MSHTLVIECADEQAAREIRGFCISEGSALYPTVSERDEQISALQREVARLTTQAQHLAELHARMVRELVSDRDTLKRYLGAIAEALGQPIEHDARKYFKEYLPDQLAEMVTALIKRSNTFEEAANVLGGICGELREKNDTLKRENKALRQALTSLANESYGFLKSANVQDHGVTNMRCLERRITEAREALDAAIKE